MLSHEVTVLRDKKSRIENAVFRALLRRIDLMFKIRNESMYPHQWTTNSQDIRQESIIQGKNNMPDREFMLQRNCKYFIKMICK